MYNGEQKKIQETSGTKRILQTNKKLCLTKLTNKYNKKYLSIDYYS